MPYDSWLEFRRQRQSIGLPRVSRSVLSHLYSSRHLQHAAWSNFDTFNPFEAARIVFPPSWLLNQAGATTLQTQALPMDLREGIKNYGAVLENEIGHPASAIRKAACGSVIFDRVSLRLYYSVSRWLPNLQVHATISSRVQQLPIQMAHGGGSVRTMHPFRHAGTCSEFQALNEALLDGAAEGNLELWCFRARSMEPMPRCQNCRVTVPSHALARIWTC